MFVAFSFTSAVDLIISLEEDGFVSGFAEVYVREVPPRPASGGSWRAAPCARAQLRLPKSLELECAQSGQVPWEMWEKPKIL